MSTEYSYAIDDSVLAVFGDSPKRAREEILRIFRAFAVDPFVVEDSVQESKSGQLLKVKRLGRWLVTYWVDHAACEVRIVDLKRIAG